MEGTVTRHSRACPAPGFGGNYPLDAGDPLRKPQKCGMGVVKPLWELLVAMGLAMGSRLGVLDQTHPHSVTRRWTGSGASAGVWIARRG